MQVFVNSSYIAQTKLLEIMITGKLEGKVAYKKKLSKFINTYKKDKPKLTKYAEQLLKNAK